MTDKQESHDSYDMFLGALDVLNKSMENFRDKPVLKDLLALVDGQTAGRKFGVAVYADDPEKPFDYYTIRLHNKRFEMVSRGKDAPDIDWKVSTEFLQDINDNPQDYISNPLKFDLDWLKHRLSDAAQGG
ncbi:hypothetical protein DWB85_16710 [Seongchinamella sediminis]|uniref:Uncharacterized protein n=1 Tax=Seongchinamella sediminis TaxID=2283635 RepID=A0A3L7DXS3_9GAMM|nr:hypothetical protein [Seongchinamella sediminis]RLQ20642.1 hypothetical protein DWB85_16710 [Seongchinamella sediminis]